VIKPESLECRRKCMVKMKPQKSKTDKINIIVSRNFEEPMSNCIKIFRISLHETKPDEIKIKEMQHKKSQYRSSGPDHKF
jgi:hypothetical protein